MTLRLIDTNILVYRVDPRDPVKQAIATQVLRQYASDGDAFVAHQALIETVAALTRPRADLAGRPLLAPVEANMVLGSIMKEFPVLWPTFAVVTTAMTAYITHQLSWYDAHMWAYAATNGIDELISEDFEHGRYYGDVRALDPFLQAQGGVYELPPMYAS